MTPSEKAHGPRRGPYRRANDRKLRKNADATRSSRNPRNPCTSGMTQDQLHTTENRGVPGSSPGLAIEEEPARWRFVEESLLDSRSARTLPSAFPAFQPSGKDKCWFREAAWHEILHHCRIPTWKAAAALRLNPPGCVAAAWHGEQKRGCRRFRDDTGVLARVQLWSVDRSGSALSIVAAQLPSRFSASWEREPGSAA